MSVRLYVALYTVGAVSNRTAPPTETSAMSHLLWHTHQSMNWCSLVQGYVEKTVYNIETARFAA